MYLEFITILLIILFLNGYYFYTNSSIENFQTYTASTLTDGQIKILKLSPEDINTINAMTQNQLNAFFIINSNGGKTIDELLLSSSIDLTNNLSSLVHLFILNKIYIKLLIYHNYPLVQL